MSPKINPVFLQISPDDDVGDIRELMRGLRNNYWLPVAEGKSSQKSVILQYRWMAILVAFNYTEDTVILSVQGNMTRCGSDFGVDEFNRIARALDMVPLRPTMSMPTPRQNAS